MMITVQSSKYYHRLALIGGQGFIRQQRGGCYANAVALWQYHRSTQPEPLQWSSTSSERNFATNRVVGSGSNGSDRVRRRRRSKTSLGSSSVEKSYIGEKSPSSEKKTKRRGKLTQQLYRADRVVANRSGKSRSECFELLKRQKVSILLPNDDEKVVVEAIDVSQLTKVKGPKEKIPMSARLWIYDQEIPQLPPSLVVYHKPKWVLSTKGVDSKHRKNLEGLDFQFASQMHPVGRLDYDTSGLLLFSSSGPLTQTLLHPKYNKEKEYIATVSGVVDRQALQKQMDEGIRLVDTSSRKKSQEDGHEGVQEEKQYFMAFGKIKDVQPVPTEEVKPYLDNILATLPSEYNVTDLKIRGFLNILEAKELSKVRLVVTEGKYRQVRRMLATCGHPVVSLKRERVGPIKLGDLPEGSFRNLTLAEAAWADKIAPKTK